MGPPTDSRWHDCQTEPPDDETTVLLYCGDEHDVWPAYKEANEWFWAGSGAVILWPALRWRHMPHPDDEHP